MKHKCPPPGPSYFSYMGEMVSDRLQYCYELMEDYGDIVKVPAFTRSYLVNSADFLKYILKENPDNYLKGGLGFKPIRMCLGNGLLMTEGANWRNRRRQFAPFFQPKHFSDYIEPICSLTHRHLQNWQSQFSGTHQSFDIYQAIMALVFEVTLKIFYNQNISASTLDKVLTAIYYKHAYATSLPNMLPWFPSISYFRYRKVAKFLDSFIENIISNAKKKPNDHFLVDKILNAKNLQGDPLEASVIFDEVVTFLMTGHETTGTALGWTLKLIAQYPEIQNQIKQELKAVCGDGAISISQLEQLKYTQAVFLESLRLYPPIWITLRVCQQDDYLGDYFIKKNTNLFISPYTLHRRSLYWEDALKFKPERHLPDYEKQPPEFAFIPFLKGPRGCIAGAFAMKEAVLILAVLMQNLTLKLDEDHPLDFEHIISLKPKYGIKVFL